MGEFCIQHQCASSSVPRCWIQLKEALKVLYFGVFSYVNVCVPLLAFV